MIGLIEVQISLGNTLYHFLINEESIKDILPSLRVKNGHVVSPPHPYNKIRIDKAHGQHGQEHIHIYKNGEFIVINKDGSRRHGTDGVLIPKELQEWLKENFPDFNIPERINKYSDLPDHLIKEIIIFFIG